ncbi:MAG: hypothetical protein ACM3PY_03950, partial [Omnitrophica WOR_2 bacterium]
MNLILTGIVAGLAAAPAWTIVNLFVDFLFLPVFRRHTDHLNPYLLARPGLNFLILVVDIAFWGAVFGAGYSLLYPGLQHFGLAGSLIWSLFMFIAFSRSIVEGSLWAKVPLDMNLFWFFEGLLGLLA